jgi:membrane associated rhomboid family serine protease
LRITASGSLGPRTATYAIAIFTALAWAIAAALGLNDAAGLLLGFIPARLSGLTIDFAGVPAFLTPLTATLVHSGILHLGLNILIFAWCGLLVERVLGSAALVFIYVVSAYAAALAQWAASPMSTVPMVGASGAISGVIGAFALSFGQQKRIVRNNNANALLNGLWLLAAWIVLQLMTGMLAGTQGLLLATPAHIGGFVAGMLLQRPLLLWRYRKA